MYLTINLFKRILYQIKLLLFATLLLKYYLIEINYNNYSKILN